MRFIAAATLLGIEDKTRSCTTRSDRRLDSVRVLRGLDSAIRVLRTQLGFKDFDSLVSVLWECTKVF